LAMHMYAQDYDERFPNAEADGTNGLAELSYRCLSPNYIGAAKLFVCPSSGDEVADSVDELTSGHLSYAYFINQNDQTSTDTAIASDQTDADDGAGADCDLEADAPHGKEGINVLFVDGHVKWHKGPKVDVANIDYPDYLNPGE